MEARERGEGGREGCDCFANSPRVRPPLPTTPVSLHAPSPRAAVSRPAFSPLRWRLWLQLQVRQLQGQERRGQGALPQPPKPHYVQIDALCVSVTGVGHRSHVASV